MIATDTFRAHPIDFKVPAIAALQSEFNDVKVEVYNRSQAGAWGEYAFGLGSDGHSPSSTLIYITVSYYVNLGVIINGQLFGGSRGLAGQFAHVVVEPTGPKCPACYQHGCIWVLASGYAIARDFAEKYVRQGQGKKVLDIIQSRNPKSWGKFDLGGTFTTSVEGREVTVDGRAVVDSAQNGDIEATKIVERAGTYMGRGVAHMINTFNPDIVAMGALGARSSVMIEALQIESRASTINAAWANTTIQQSQHDDMTPIIGAALLARP
jgi:glucokinase